MKSYLLRYISWGKGLLWTEQPFQCKLYYIVCLCYIIYHVLLIPAIYLIVYYLLFGVTIIINYHDGSDKRFQTLYAKCQELVFKNRRIQICYERI